MKLKPKIRRVLHAIIASIILACVGLLLGFVNYEQTGQQCRGVNISIQYLSPDTLLTIAEIDSTIRAATGKLKGKPMWQINTALVEQAIGAHPYVMNANVFETTEGRVYIELTQREPVVRVILKNNNTFYISGDGKLMSVDTHHPTRVLVASGEIPGEQIIRAPLEGSKVKAMGSIAGNTCLTELFTLARYIRDDPFFSRQVEQVYVTPSGEFELIPKVGKHIILFGTTRDMQDKFHRLWAFYISGLNQIGWNQYSVLNVKYKNQVVCSRQ